MSYSPEYLAIRREWWLRDMSRNEGDVMRDDFGDEYVISEYEREEDSRQMKKIYLPNEIQNLYELA